MSLLDDLQDEHHAQLLEKGNLGPKAEPDRTLAWKNRSWTTVGYVARVHTNACCCGASSSQLVGVFHRERSQAGTIRDTYIPPKGLRIPPGEYPTEHTKHLVQLCPECIRPLGFK